MTDKQSMYNTVFSLIEEEVHQRMNPSGYNNNKYDGTNHSICGSSNVDIASLEKIQEMAGGGKESDNYIPGKFDAVRHSYRMPLEVAIMGSVKRQRLFAKERSKQNV